MNRPDKPQDGELTHEREAMAMPSYVQERRPAPVSLPSADLPPRQYCIRYYEDNLLLTPSEYKHDLSVVERNISGLGSDSIPFSYLNNVFLGDSGRKLLKTAVKRGVEKAGLKKYFTKISLERLTSVITQYLFDQSGSTLAFNLSAFLEGQCMIKQFRNVAMKESEKRLDNILDDRSRAAKVVERMMSGIAHQEHRFALSDRDMKRFFKTQKSMEELDDNCLSTYFSTAFIGLANKELRPFVDSLEDARKDFYDLVSFCKEKVLVALSGTAFPRQFSNGLDPDHQISGNVFFTENGTGAGKLMIRNCIGPSDKVIVSPQEFGKFVTMIGPDRTRVLDSGRDSNSYPSQIEDMLSEDDSIRFILMSDISRLGSQFPIHEIARLRDRVRSACRELFLVVDACQTVGRKPLEYLGLAPDAVIASAQKGADIADETGFLAASNTLIRHGLKLNHSLIDDGEEVIEAGSKYGNHFASMRFALDPEAYLDFPLAKSSLSDSMKSRLFTPVPERRRVLQMLSAYFLHVIEGVNANAKSGGVRILNPSTQQLNADPNNSLTGIFELELVGCSSEKARKIAKDHGVQFDVLSDGSKPDTDTIRVAFHPCMSKKAIRILGYVFLQALSETRKT